MGQITQQHEDIFQALWRQVDNAGTRAALSHLWDTIKDVAGVAVPAVEAAAPAVAPALNVAAMSIEEVDKAIQALLDAKAQKLASAPSTSQNA